MMVRTQNPRPAPAIRVAPTEPIKAILDVFRTRDVVALPGTHGGEPQHQFALSLIRNSAFASLVNDIVVEFGSGQNQATIDRYLKGENVPHPELRKVWQDTTVADTTWDVPIIEEFYRTVREVNSRLPAARQVRVLLGDTPVDWTRLTTPADHERVAEDRDTFAADLLQKEVIARKRKALVLYGDGHYWRHQPHTIVSQFERATGLRVFTVSIPSFVDLSRLDPEVVKWPIPSYAALRGTNLGRLDWGLLLSTATCWDPWTST